MWQGAIERGDVLDAVAFIVAVLGGSLERETVAAAAALIRIFEADRDSDAGSASYWLGSMRVQEPGATWSPDLWSRRVARFRDQPEEGRRFGLLDLCADRIELGLVSGDSVTRAMAEAATVAPDIEDPVEPAKGRSAHANDSKLVSTLIHGTSGWKRDWWRPTGKFFAFASTLRTDLFAGGARYSWSGSIEQTQRVLAARDLLDWSEQLAPAGLRTVFAHSYGGEVLARAVLSGLAVAEPVLFERPDKPIRPADGR